jgi:hypothetical protein
MDQSHRFLFVAIAATASACGGGGGGSSPPAGPDLVTTLTLARNGGLPNMENSVTVTLQGAGTAVSAGGVLTIPPTAGFAYETASCTAAGGAVCPASVTSQALAAGMALASVPVGGSLTLKLDGITTGAIGSAVNFTATASLPGDVMPGNNVAQRSVTVTAPAAATLVTSVPAPTYPAGSDELAAFNWVNAERTRCGMGLLKQVASLDASAVDHAAYLAVNNDNGNIVGLTHVQNPNFPGFTGVDGPVRAVFRGYAGYAGDLVGGSVSALDVYKGLFARATFHSLAAQGRSGDVGLGGRFSTVARSWLGVFNVGIASTQLLSGDTVATYPCDGVANHFRNHSFEIPSPFPPNVNLVDKGPPITIFVRDGQRLEVREVLLTDPNGVNLPGTILTSANTSGGFISGSQAAFVPDAVLAANSTFNVTIRGTNDGQRFEKRFSFTTGS